MDDPEVSIHSGWEATVLRSALALVSGETLSMAGHSFLVTAEDVGRAKELARLVGGFEAVATPHSATFSLKVDPPACPTRLADEEYDDLELWREKERLVLRDPFGVSGWADRDRIVIGGPDGLGPSLRAMFLPLTTHLLAFRDVFVIHAAAADAGNGALLFLGASGAGKSTLAGLSLSKGWDVLGDDTVALRTDSEGVQVMGVPRPPAVPVEAAPEDAAGSSWLDARGRRHLDPDVLDKSPHQVIGSVMPFRAKYGQEEGDQTSAPYLLHLLIGSFTSATTRHLLSRFFPVAAKVAEYPGYSLPVTADDPDRLAATGDRLQAVASMLGGDLRR